MSNIFINRNRSQGAYNVPILKQKFANVEQTWKVRSDAVKNGTGDNFYKTSLKYGKNPDLQPAHVGMGWSIQDSCDVVKPNHAQMEEKWYKTETSAPLHRAYSVYENPKQTYDQRIDQFPGPGSPLIQTSMQSNGFVGYANSGGISRKEHLKSEINTIAERIARAKDIKGVLCLNNRKANFGSFKTPALDLALQNRSGLAGGETNMRFYMKFPIYRPRGHGPPDVEDDIDAIWKEQLDLAKTG